MSVTGGYTSDTDPLQLHFSTSNRFRNWEKNQKFGNLDFREQNLNNFANYCVPFSPSSLALCAFVHCNPLLWRWWVSSSAGEQSGGEDDHSEDLSLPPDSDFAQHMHGTQTADRKHDLNCSYCPQTSHLNNPLHTSILSVCFHLYPPKKKKNLCVFPHFHPWSHQVHRGCGRNSSNSAAHHENELKLLLSK